MALEAGHFAATARHVDNSLSLVSANLSYHFGGRRSEKKAVPFVAGGLSIGNGRSGDGNFGGGIQYWLHERVALRLEFREHIFPSDSPFVYGVHFGLAFR